MPDISEVIFMKGDGEDVLFIRFAIQCISKRVTNHAVASMVDAVAINTYAVYTNYIALIFDGACCQ